MTALQTQRLCVFLAIISLALMELSTFLIAGNYNPHWIRQLLTVILLIWLYQGSNIARWIMVVLSILSVLTIGSIAPSLLLNLGNEQIPLSTKAGFGAALMAVLMLSVTAWKLIFLPKTKNHHAQTGD